jgi:hypothetical protein
MQVRSRESTRKDARADVYASRNMQSPQGEPRKARAERSTLKRAATCKERLRAQPLERTRDSQLPSHTSDLMFPPDAFLENEELS